MLIERAIRRLAASAFVATALFCIAAAPSQAEERLTWSTIRPGMQLARYQLAPPGSMLKSEVLILAIDPAQYALQLSLATDGGVERSDVKSLVRRMGGVAGINGNFFDEHNLALGLVLRGADVIRPIHAGGSLLTGVFYVADGVPAIVHRKDFAPRPNMSIAFQAGPRLIVNREPVQLGSLQDSSRRSGIAITEDNRVLLYATLVRFPGASLEELQKMLLDPQLNVKDALNLDGGGSSQLYVEAAGELVSELNISGGDLVPVGLVVKPRNNKHPVVPPRQ